MYEITIPLDAESKAQLEKAATILGADPIVLAHSLLAHLLDDDDFWDSLEPTHTH